MGDRSSSVLDFIVDGYGPLLGWLEFYAEFWTKRLDNLEKLLSEMDR